ncbi:MAG: hypothetical protein K2X81_10260, partial [Candidatus Obscuribacterales bacterium]|nr:hypothetical protein [Candidatus Obscuribacterales bacterium]
NNLSGAFEQFMMDAPLFQSDASFANAAMALDLTAQLFSTIDTDKNHLLSREEFAYMLQKTTDANRQALSWLVENFNAFTQACFFKDQIGKDDIEAARNVFHGLKVVNDKFGFNKPPSLENLKDLDPSKVKEFLDGNKDSLSPHEAAGLQYLLDHIKKHGTKSEKLGKNEGAEKTEKTEKNSSKQKGNRLHELDGVIDQRSLKTLQGLKLNSFDSMFHAFVGFLEDPASFRGDTPFNKAANALDTSASLVSDLEMDPEHMFTRDEMLIVTKLSPSKEKKQMSWLVKHFDAFTKAFFLPGKAKKRDLLGARNIFHGLGFVRERFDLDEDEDPMAAQDLKREIRNYLDGHKGALEAHNRIGLQQLVEFMERHANQ